MKDVIDSYDLFFSDDKERYNYINREMEILDYNSSIKSATDEGRKEGREEGRIEGREIGQEETTVKFIWSLHEMKCTDDMISEAVKRPIDYVQDILKKDAPQ